MIICVHKQCCSVAYINKSELFVPKENTIHKFDKLKQNYSPRWKKPLLLSTAKRRGTGNSAHLLRLFLLPPKCHFRFVCNHHQHRSSDSQKVHSSSSYIRLFLHVVTRVRGHGTGGRKVVGGRRHGRDPAGRVVVPHPRAGEHQRRLRLHDNRLVLFLLLLFLPCRL